MSKFFLTAMLILATLPYFVVANDVTDAALTRTIANSIANLNPSGSATDEAKPPVDPNPEVTLKKLSELFGQLEEKANSDPLIINVEVYDAFVKANSDAAFAGLSLPAQAAWKEIRDQVLSKVLAAIPATTTPAEKLAEYRKLMRGPVKKAIDAEVFRIVGNGGEALSAQDAKLVNTILVFVLNAQRIPDNHHWLTDYKTELVPQPEDGKIFKLPGTDQARVVTCKKLVALFETLESKVDPEWNVEAYKGFIVGTTNEMFVPPLHPDSIAGWKNGRTVILNGVAKTAKNDLKEYRRLINGPVKRALETEIARIEGIKTRTPMNLKGLSNAQLQAIANQGAGGTQRNLRRDAKCRCWWVLLGP